MNAIRYRIAEELKPLVRVLTTSFGSRTKFNRRQFDIPKEHCLDALFSGETRNVKNWEKLPILVIRCMGRGRRSRTLLDRYGFPRACLPRKITFFGFKTGDIVKAVVEKGKKAGVYIGRVAVRSSGSFNINTGKNLIQGLSHKWFKLIQPADGYLYFLTRPDWRRISSPA